MADSVEALSQKFEAFDDVMQKILDKVTGLEAWKTSADASMSTLLSKADDTAARLQRLEVVPVPPPVPIRQPPHPPPPSAGVNPFDLNLAPNPAARPSASAEERPSGHRAAQQHRVDGGGILGSHPPRPVTGMNNSHPPRQLDFMSESDSRSVRSGPKPKLEFPKFNGHNPRLWKDRCELYFEVYGVSEALKPRFAALNFEDSAVAWLQTVELRGRINSWEELHTAVCERFDRDQYQHHLRQLDNLRQSGSVAEYHAKFEQLVHSTLLYNDSYDDVYLVTRFLGGLKEEIRAPIALHRPKNVDTASALALLQEEELEFRKNHVGARSDNRAPNRSGSKVFTALDHGKSMHKKDDMKKSEQSSADSKMQALLAHRKANGLCFTCGEKWTGKSHKCPEHIPLHVVQELVSSIQSGLSSADNDSDSEDDFVEDCVMALPLVPAQQAPDRPAKRKTMRFRGIIEQQDVLILLDSGSACTFINEELASQFQHKLQPCEPLQFTTADGTPMLSDKCIP